MKKIENRMKLESWWALVNIPLTLGQLLSLSSLANDTERHWSSAPLPSVCSNRAAGGGGLRVAESP
jgi:hypothetical protein